MKKFRSILLLFVILLTGCRKDDVISGYQNTQRPETEWGVVMDDDNQWYLSHHEAESENGIYFIADVSYCREVFYFDKETKMVFPLCSKAECEHNNENCDACISGLLYEIYYYDGKLYYLTSDSEGTYLNRMDVDGGNRERVRKMLDEKEGDWELIMHRGKFYYIYGYGIYELDFNSNRSEERKIGTIDDDMFMNFMKLFAYGNQVYWTTASSDKMESYIYCYYIDEGVTELVKTLPLNYSVCMVPVNEHEILYYVPGTGMLSYRLDTKEENVLYEMKDGMIRDVYSDGRSIVLVNWRARKGEGEQKEEIYLFDDQYCVTGQYSQVIDGILWYRHIGPIDHVIVQYFEDNFGYMDLTQKKLQYQSAE